LALLFSTGLRISEALALRPGDMTRDGLVIQKTKFQKSRLVPLHQTAEEGLSRYLVRRKRVFGCDGHLFVSVRGRVLDRSGVYWTFVKLLKSTGLDPGSEGRRPRIHDIRHTFAVRALTNCPEGRDNVGRHMLALSTYLGHANLSDTYWYLESTPHLMQDIQDACDVFVNGERR
jgi:integrase